MTEKLRIHARVAAAILAVIALVAVGLLSVSGAVSAASPPVPPNPLLQATNLTAGQGGTVDQGKLSWTPPPIVANGSATFGGQTWYPAGYVVAYWPELESKGAGAPKRLWQSGSSLWRSSASLSFLAPGEWCARVYVNISLSSRGYGNTPPRWGGTGWEEGWNIGAGSDEVCFTIATLVDTGGTGGGPQRDRSIHDSNGEPYGKANFKECVNGRPCNDP